jgi:hypothetical protein
MNTNDLQVHQYQDKYLHFKDIFFSCGLFLGLSRSCLDLLEQLATVPSSYKRIHRAQDEPQYSDHQRIGQWCNDPFNNISTAATKIFLYQQLLYQKKFFFSYCFLSEKKNPFRQISQNDRFMKLLIKTQN